MIKLEVFKFIFKINHQKVVTNFLKAALKKKKKKKQTDSANKTKY